MDRNSGTHKWGRPYPQHSPASLMQSDQVRLAVVDNDLTHLWNMVHQLRDEQKGINERQATTNSNYDKRLETVEDSLQKGRSIVTFLMHPKLWAVVKFLAAAALAGAALPWDKIASRLLGSG